MPHSSMQSTGPSATPELFLSAGRRIRPTGPVDNRSTRAIGPFASCPEPEQTGRPVPGHRVHVRAHARRGEHHLKQLLAKAWLETAWAFALGGTALPVRIDGHVGGPVHAAKLADAKVSLNTVRADAAGRCVGNDGTPTRHRPAIRRGTCGRAPGSPSVTGPARGSPTSRDEAHLVLAQTADGRLVPAHVFRLRPSSPSAELSVPPGGAPETAATARAACRHAGEQTSRS